MRLIDADALIESICHTADLGGWIGDTLRNIKRLAVRYINETPTIDAVSVVRCKDCKYWIDNSFEDDDLFRECRWRDEETTDADDFCSYGERKESE